MKDYTGSAACPKCGETSNSRNLLVDNPSTFVVRGDDQITLGELAERNSKRFSPDKKAHLFEKHNEYRNQTEDEDDALPDGMTKITPPKNKTPFGPGKKRREVSTNKVRKTKHG